MRTVKAGGKTGVYVTVTAKHVIAVHSCGATPSFLLIEWSTCIFNKLQYINITEFAELISHVDLKSGCCCHLFITVVEGRGWIFFFYCAVITDKGSKFTANLLSVVHFLLGHQVTVPPGSNGGLVSLTAALPAGSSAGLQLYECLTEPVCTHCSDCPVYACVVWLTVQGLSLDLV